MQTKKYQIDFHNRPLAAEFSDLTEQANGSVIVKYGDTTVMATVVMAGQAKENINHFPLTVDYEEKFYAAGKILGGRFMRREGRPSEEAVLNGRMIDRTLRPLFDGRMRNEIQVIVTTLSMDENNDPDTPAILASSLALATSDIPWNGPIGAVRIGRINNELVINPTYEEKEKSDLDLVVCGKDGKINMVEGGADQVPEEIVLEAMEKVLPEINKIVDFQNKIIKEIGKQKVWPEIKENPEGLESLFEKHAKERLENALSKPSTKKEHYFILEEIKKDWMQISENKFGGAYLKNADDFFEENINNIIHKNVLEKELRPDGRKLDEVRPLFTKTGILTRAHGSGLFYRGLTHILSVATLGAPGDFLIIEGMEIRTKKSFMHHYNFPPFSVGETGRLGGPNRRSIGHGALAEKALIKIIPEKEKFPYTIRLVSETMSSNGSSSMGSVCASTLALMDAGIPIKAPVSGIAMGVMSEGENNYKILTDIQGPEDHHGDTDFKVAGTKNGITAIQMDVKVSGLTVKILKDLLAQSKKARLEILENMLQTISEPRKELSPYAPQIIIIQINPEKKGALIGPGGKTINKIIDETGVQIDIDENGQVFVTGATKESLDKAKELIDGITYEPKAGELHQGKVVKIMDFGAFVEIKPGVDGLVHVSEIAPFRVENVTDILKEGDIVPVKVVEIDNLGRVNLSIKQADPDYARRKQQPKPQK
ncbi:polyribonucleotide nucleotidyltransferase [Patescibacteria group bacterium]|nr:polyribonucleotide nucleotidyltransferase [Patescibacteria group bacterium]